METCAHVYRAIGARVRAARERLAPKVSQAALAKRVAVSRASIVNIEAGRQHAPLHLLWQIAEALDTEAVALIPRRAELSADVPGVELSAAMKKQIRREADGNEALELTLNTIIGKLILATEDTKEPR